MRIEKIIHKLSKHRPQRQVLENARQAAVAMLLTDSTGEPEVLFIRRAEYEGDPWSGDIAFPGGGIEVQDTGARQAAEREAWEEIGLKLETGQYLGQLDDLSGAYLPIQISCFVYLLQKKPTNLRLNGEVVDTFWVPLRELLNPQRRRDETFEFRGSIRTHPIIDLSGYCERFLWGITYRLFENFFAVTDCQPHTTSRKT
ncbi:CoA pyrophosphatase [Malonomonas rubra]|uniref:NUDIX hydrolase n=1 Tax=Malonomonas rubra TaxID=57040 RepID=UPI0026EFB78D|nr:CoA pyrophosphatase [Malonomonas rubra]